MSLPEKPLVTDHDFRVFAKMVLARRKIIDAAQIGHIAVENISGNINRVRRVRFFDRDNNQIQSVVIKTVPEGGTLERYPDIMFPEDRLSYEFLYASRAGNHENLAPRILYTNDPVTVIVMEDLAPALTLQEAFLAGDDIKPESLRHFGRELARFHDQSRNEVYIHNPAAAENRPYVLTVPFQKAAEISQNWPETWRQELQQDFLKKYAGFEQIAQDMISQFKNVGGVLTHGDLHGDSLFLRADGAITAIDAELCDKGSAWFDTGTVLAHLMMLSFVSGHKVDIKAFMKGYESVAGQDKALHQMTEKLAAFEIIRRVIGIANMSYIKKEHGEPLLEQAVHMIKKKPSLS